MMIQRPIESLHMTARHRPPHYLERVFELGKVFEDQVQFTPENYLTLVGEFSPELLPTIRAKVQAIDASAMPFDKWPLWAKALSRFAKAEDKGIGDLVYRHIGESSSNTFKAWYRATFKRDCGCSDRRQQWNAKYPLR